MSAATAMQIGALACRMDERAAGGGGDPLAHDTQRRACLPAASTPILKFGAETNSISLSVQADGRWLASLATSSPY